MLKLKRWAKKKLSMMFENYEIIVEVTYREISD